MRAGSFIPVLHFFAIEMIWARAKEPMNPSSSFANVFGLKSKFGGNRQYYLGSCSGITEKVQLGANAFGPLPYSLQPPVSRFPRLQHLSVDAATVVLNQHTKPICGVFHLDFDVGCSRVLKRVHDGFASDSVDIVQENWPQRSRAAFDAHPESNIRGSGKFLRNARQSLPELQVTELRGTNSSEGDSAFLTRFSNEFQGSP
jgi:hypothetical protein